jgi:hypothetical protein
VLEKPDRPVLVDKWKRLTFQYAPGELLLKAEILNELVVNSDERLLPRRRVIIAICQKLRLTRQFWRISWESKKHRFIKIRMCFD